MIDKVVILAAGLGNRIARATSVPKPFLPLDGTDGGNPPSFVMLNLFQHPLCNREPKFAGRDGP